MMINIDIPELQIYSTKKIYTIEISNDEAVLLTETKSNLLKETIRQLQRKIELNKIQEQYFPIDYLNKI